MTFTECLEGFRVVIGKADSIIGDDEVVDGSIGSNIGIMVRIEWKWFVPDDFQSNSTFVHR